MQTLTNVCLVVLLALGAGTAAAFDLVSEAEALREQALGEPRTVQPPVEGAGQRPAGPVIRIVAPSSTAGALAVPLRIELAFKATGNARIIASSFKVFYGLLRLDITERLLPHAKLSDSGLVADDCRIPAGSHRIFLRISDDQGAVAETELRVQVRA